MSDPFEIPQNKMGDSATYAAGFESQCTDAEPQSLTVQGKLPEWLDGILVRTGPAQFEIGEEKYRHWFDGLAMLHGFSIRDRCVTYRRSMLESETYLEANKRGRISRSEFGTDPCRTLFGRFVSLFSRPLTDNCSVNIEVLGPRWIAMTETRLPIQFDPEMLTVRERELIGSHISGPIVSAHPQIDSDRGLAYNHTIHFGFRSCYRFFSTDLRTFKQQVIAEVPVDRPAYLHSFGMTNRYLVLVEFPFVVHPLRLRFSGDPFIQNYRWMPERGVRFHVIDKVTGEVVREALSPACFAFHHVNAFEKDDELVIDLVQHDDPSVIDQLYLDRLRSLDPVRVTGFLTRYHLQANGQVSLHRLSETPFELPRFDVRRVSKSYRHLFGVSVTEARDFIDALAKIDVQTGDSIQWTQSGCYPGEPIFVPRPNAKADDEGVLLSVVLDANVGTSYLLVLDAKTMREIARAETPEHIPFGFHGHFG